MVAGIVGATGGRDSHLDGATDCATIAPTVAATISPSIHCLTFPYSMFARPTFFSFSFFELQFSPQRRSNFNGRQFK